VNGRLLGLAEGGNGHNQRNWQRNCIEEEDVTVHFYCRSAVHGFWHLTTVLTEHIWQLRDHWMTVIRCQLTRVLRVRYEYFIALDTANMLSCLYFNVSLIFVSLSVAFINKHFIYF